MRSRTLVLAILATLISSLAAAQIATPGSRPVGLGGEGTMRSILHLPALRLGAFDRDSALHALESADREALRVYLFAHKEETDIDLIRTAHHTRLSDGRQVWQCRVTSPRALSLSFFFEEVDLSGGAQLFVYDESQEMVLGGYGSINVTPTRTLAVMPIEASDVVLEVQAPEGVTPSLRLREVNHGLRPLTRAAAFGSNFGWHQKDLTCTPEVVCMPGLDETKRAVVAVVIGGVGIGTGTMVASTDPTLPPYLLTAAHVLSQNFTHMRLERQAERTVAIFNYDSPSCSGEVMPDMRQSVSGATVVGFDKPTDACLIRLNQAPPESYRPYYMGWSAEEHPQGTFTNIHHPYVMTKRVNYFATGLRENVTCYTSENYFGDHLHYEVPAWDVGTTAGGSSGSPLIDRNQRVIGGLSAGRSYCGVKAPDYFFSLANVWKQGRDGTESIVRALARGGSALTCDGRDPYSTPRSQARRLTHVSAALTRDSISETQTQLSREAILGGADAVGEYYILSPQSTLYGAYVMLDMSGVNPSEISGEEALTLEVYTQGAQDHPTQSVETDLAEVMRTTLSSSYDRLKYRELFIPFETPIQVGGDGSVILAVTTRSIPRGVTILHQQYTGEGGQMMAKSAGKWAPRRTSEGTIALWIDPLLSESGEGSGDQVRPLLALIPMGDDQIMVKVADRVEEGADLMIYTLQGQRVYSKRLTSSVTLLDRRMLEGLGIVVLHLDAGDEQMTLKALFPAH